MNRERRLGNPSEKYADGAVKRWVLPDGSRRTEIASRSLRSKLLITQTNPQARYALGPRAWGVVIIGYREYIQIEQFIPNNPVFQFSLDGEKLGTAIGTDFDLAIAVGLGVFSVPTLNIAAKGSSADVNFMNYLKFRLLDSGDVSPTNPPKPFLRQSKR